MDNMNQALQQYLVQHAHDFTATWLKRQKIKTGSDYSPDSSSIVQDRIKEQNARYVCLVADSLLQDEKEMKEAVSSWTSLTAADRVQSNTDLSEVAWNSGVFRRVYWEYIQKFVQETNQTITVDALFEWERRINTTLDYVLESFVSHYMEILMNRLSSQTILIKELSTPVITLTEKVGLLPLIGDIDTTRAQSLLESALTQSSDSLISLLIIDLSGVVLVDTMVAHQIFKLIESLRLIGIKSVLTGIRPEVAQTAVQLGIDFSDIITAGNLQNAIKQYVVR